MDRTWLTDELVHRHSEFIKSLKKLTPIEIATCPEGKWSPAQHLEHIRMSVRPVAVLISLPSFVTKLVFGTVNRQPNSYEELVARYIAKLNAGGKAPKAFTPREVGPEMVVEISSKIMKDIDKICQRLSQLTDDEIDSIVIPHPLLGKVTIREMLYFTMYHVQHHKRMALKSQHQEQRAKVLV